MNRFLNWLFGLSLPTKGKLVFRLYGDNRLLLKQTGTATFHQKGSVCYVTNGIIDLWTSPIAKLKTVYVDRITVSLVEFPSHEVEVWLPQSIPIEMTTSQIELTGEEEHGAFLTLS